MKNIGLTRIKVSNAETFTTDVGIKLRKKIAKPLNFVLKKATRGEIIVEHYISNGENKEKLRVKGYPVLDKNKNYIFVSTHYFSEDIISALATVDRGAYTLIGCTNQVECNPKMYAAWLRGIIYVDRLDGSSRKESVKKMERILSSGASVILYPEGGWNNTENLLCQEIFSGAYILSKKTNVEIMPISQFYKEETEEIYVGFGEPLDLTMYDKKEANKILRDELATMMYMQIESYSVPIERAKYKGDLHMYHMEKRLAEYAKQKWTKDVWDEELTRYSDKNNPRPDQIRKSLRKIEITPENAQFFTPLIKEMAMDQKYDFNKYMHENFEYDKPKVKCKIKKTN